jgi:hypothetical protein
MVNKFFTFFFPIKCIILSELILFIFSTRMLTDQESGGNEHVIPLSSWKNGKAYKALSNTGNNQQQRNLAGNSLRGQASYLDPKPS